MAHTRFTLTLLSDAFLAGGAATVANTDLRHPRTGEPPRHRRIGMDGDGLRIPSLRGVLRFWFRAKQGDSGGNGLADLARHEALVFGSTRTGQGIRIVPESQSSWQPQLVRAPRNSAKAYLGYGPLNDVKGEFSSHNKSSFRDSIPAGERFTFLAFGADAAICELHKSLLLLHLFGGLGGRSRRGWGSVAVEGEAIPMFAGGTPLKAYVAEVLSRVWPDPSDAPSGRTGLPRFSAFYAGTQMRGFEVPKGAGWEAVLDAFYARFKAIRLYNRNRPEASPPMALSDHALEALDLGQGHISGAPQRLAFGLPYQATLGRAAHHSQSIEYEGVYRDERGEHAVSRRASPLFLKVLRDDKGQYHGISLHLGSQFFGRSGVEIRAKGKPGRVAPPVGFGGAVAQFLEAPNWVPLGVP